VSASNLKDAFRAINFIKYFRAIEPEMPSQHVEVFLTIAARPGIATKELMQAVEISQSSMSRATRALSERQLNGSEGHHLIEAKTDPLDSRILQWSLTPGGAAVYEALIATMNGEPAPRPDTFKRPSAKKGGKLKAALA
jgi:DNA-binding MarR family transcriptional regulator